MNAEKLIVALIVGVVLFFTIRSLVRMWRSDSGGGCGSCPGCANHRAEDGTNNSEPQDSQSDGGAVK